VFYGVSNCTRWAQDLADPAQMVVGDAHQKPGASVRRNPVSCVTGVAVDTHCRIGAVTGGRTSCPFFSFFVFFFLTAPGDARWSTTPGLGKGVVRNASRGAGIDDEDEALREFAARPGPTRVAPDVVAVRRSLSEQPGGGIKARFFFLNEARHAPPRPTPSGSSSDSRFRPPDIELRRLGSASRGAIFSRRKATAADPAFMPLRTIFLPLAGSEYALEGCRKGHGVLVFQRCVGHVVVGTPAQDSRTVQRCHSQWHSLAIATTRKCCVITGSTNHNQV